MRQNALALAERGFHVFPIHIPYPHESGDPDLAGCSCPDDGCENQGKHPRTAWRESATTDRQQINDWWRRWPDANIGIHAGKSNLVILDIDRLDAIEELEELAGIELGGTLTALTGRPGGGVHLYYRETGEHGNQRGQLPTGIDVRGVGGYVLAPPSLHPSSIRYEWDQKREPAELPAALADVMEDDGKPDPLPAEQVELNPDRVASEWGRTVLAGETSKVMVAQSPPAGTGRNNQLYASGLLVYGAVKGGHLDKAEADLSLQRAAQAVGLGVKEVAKTLESAWHAAEPRTPPDRPLPEKAPHPADAANEPAQQQPAEPATPPEGSVVGAEVDVSERHVGGHATFDVLDLEQLANLPPPKWLLNDRVPEGLTVIVGQPSAGKSFVALDMVLTVSAQVDRPVLYFAGEGVSGYRLRADAWKLANPQFNPDSFRLVPTVPRMMDPTQIAMLKATAAKYEPSVIVIDTFARSLVGGDENSATDMGLFIDTLDQIRERHGTSAVVVHHVNVAGTRERGNGALKGAADIMWHVSRDEDYDEIVLDLSKPPKDGEPPAGSRHILKQFGESAALWRPTWQEIGGVL